MGFALAEASPRGVARVDRQPGDAIYAKDPRLPSRIASAAWTALSASGRISHDGSSFQ